jgi:hypothetical protein
MAVNQHIYIHIHFLIFNHFYAFKLSRQPKADKEHHMQAFLHYLRDLGLV